MKDTLTVINSLESDGIIGKYAIGGAVGVLFYAEPTLTYDLDIFCHLPRSEGGLIELSALYDHLVDTKGYKVQGEHIVVEGIPVQFLPPSSDLLKEALDNAVEREFDGVPTRVFQYEHLLAIMVEIGRAKDRARVAHVLESAQPDTKRLKDILGRHGLLEKWSKMSV